MNNPLGNKFLKNSLIFAFEELKYFTKVTTIGFGYSSSFCQCTNLERINTVNIKILNGSTGTTGDTGSPFCYTKVVELNLPNLEKTGPYAFKSRGNDGTAGYLRRVTIGEKYTNIDGAYSWAYANQVEKKIYTKTPPTLSSGTLQTHGSGTRYVYVPDDAVDDWKAAPAFANWADKIKPLSECPW